MATHERSERLSKLLTPALLLIAACGRLDDVEVHTISDDFPAFGVRAIQVRCLTGYVPVVTELPNRSIDIRCVRTEPPPETSRPKEMPFMP